jgi:hypothetical protein
MRCRKDGASVEYPQMKTFPRRALVPIAESSVNGMAKACEPQPLHTKAKRKQIAYNAMTTSMFNKP